MKRVCIPSYSGPHFPAFGLNTETPYSVQMRENADQNNFDYGHFLRGKDYDKDSVINQFYTHVSIYCNVFLYSFEVKTEDWKLLK